MCPWAVIVSSWRDDIALHVKRRLRQRRPAESTIPSCTLLFPDVSLPTIHSPAIDYHLSVREPSLAYINGPPSLDKGNHGRHLFLVVDVVIAEEADEVGLFVLDAGGKELPEDGGVADEAERIAEHELGAEPPPEEAEVGRVAERAVDARRHQAVAVPLAVLHNVVERRARLHHGRATHKLSPSHEHQAQKHDCVRHVHRQSPVPPRERQLRDQALEQRRRVRDRVRRPVGREQERADFCLRRVVLGGGPELEEVESREGADKEGQAPERARGQREDEAHSDDGQGESATEAEGPQRDALERLGLAR